MKKSNLIYNMLTENTGASFLDSGSYYGRHWEENQKKTLEEFENMPSVSFEVEGNEIIYTINVYHYLMSDGLQLDAVCDKFNNLKCNDWNSNIYGVSTDQFNWLINKGFAMGQSFNTYNGESSLSQVLQGNYLKRNNQKYVLLQIHNGCDVRGGYTDAKLFYLPEEYMPLEDVWGTMDGIQIDNQYDGISITDENGHKITPTKDSIIKLSLGY